MTFDETMLPRGPRPEPLLVPHFPDRLHAFVFRNWELVPVERLAAVLGATPAQVRAIAVPMGLPPYPPVPARSLELAYVTIIRRNWHLLPYGQLCELLGWDTAKLAYTLREDDFLYHKLGNLKPACEELSYREPGSEACRRAAAIRTLVGETVGGDLKPPAELPFAFLDDFRSPRRRTGTAHRRADAPLRLIYSYFAQYGDPLVDPESDPFPERYLEQLAEAGVNGVWMQGVLHKLAPWDLAPELSDGWQTRIDSLNGLCRRAASFDIGLYLYLNEPRSMHETFFARHPGLRGVTDRSDAGYSALCTSTSEAQAFLRSASRWVFSRAPDLAGAFTISMSENLTHCHSKGYGEECPRCRDREPAEVVAEANAAMCAGIHDANPDARFIVWDWAWPEGMPEMAVPLLPPTAWYMSVSEWNLPIQRGGVETTVGEYSISAPGPGPRAARNWRTAAASGLRPVAKIQVNNTWELSCVPYIPAVPLVAAHVERLVRSGVRDFMLSWTLGGYPSVNIDAARRLLDGSAGTAEEAVMQTAAAHFGAGAALEVVEAWRRLSDAFTHFPFHIGTVYSGPQQMGPANLLYEKPTGYAATMVGFPYDDLDRWRSVYPPDVFLSLFGELSEGWQAGVEMLEQAARRHPSERMAEHLRVAMAAGLVFRSVRAQIEFVQKRSSDPARCIRLLEEEIRSATRMLEIVQEDSRIGFEATNQYYFTRCDLIEKVLSCRQLIDRFTAAGGRARG